MILLIWSKPFAVVGDDGSNAPERAVVQELPNDIEFREERRPVRLHQEYTFAARGLSQFSGLGSVQRQRFLNENVLSCLDRSESVSGRCRGWTVAT